MAAALAIHNLIATQTAELDATNIILQRWMLIPLAIQNAAARLRGHSPVLNSSSASAILETIRREGLWQNKKQVKGLALPARAAKEGIKRSGPVSTSERRSPEKAYIIPQRSPAEKVDSPLQPSAGLQARLKDLKRKPPAYVTTFDGDDGDAQKHDPDSQERDEADKADKAGSEGVPEPSTNSQEKPLPKPTRARIRSAEYVSSSVNLQSCPPAIHPEIAVVGRSNVGKSSLINMLTGRRALALVSKTPGKTQCINHFLINESWYLVDLPGYGYAMTAKSRRLTWGKFTQNYFKHRSTLANVLLLIDSSVPAQSIDLGCAEWLWQHHVPFSLVFTKADKRKKRCPSAEENIKSFEEALQGIIGDLPVSLVTSSAGLGKDDLLGYLSVLRQMHKAKEQAHEV